MPCLPDSGHALPAHRVPPMTTTNAGMAIPETIPEEVWQALERLLPPAQPTGRPYAHDRGQVLRGVIHVFQTGCGWREIPDTFPPAITIYGQYRRWQRTGIWAAVWAVLTRWCATGELPPPPLPNTTTDDAVLGQVQATNARDDPPLVLAEMLWNQLAEFLPVPSDTGRPYTHDRRRVVEAILYKQHTNCGWRRLPATYPPAKTVYGQFRRWQTSGHWDKIVALLAEAEYVGELQL